MNMGEGNSLELGLALSDKQKSCGSHLLESHVVLLVMSGCLSSTVHLRLKRRPVLQGDSNLVEQRDDSTHDTAPTGGETWRQVQNRQCMSDCSGFTSGYWQPQEKRESRDVEVPLSSEELHVQVVEEIGVPAGVLHRLRTRVLLHLTCSISGRSRGDTLDATIHQNIATNDEFLPRKRTTRTMIIVKKHLFQ